MVLHLIPPGSKPVTDPSHLTPADHAYVMWTREREFDWARAIGPRTLAFVERQLPEGVNKTQGYRLGLSMRKLASEYGSERIESGCAYVLSKGGSRVGSLRLILSRGMDINPPTRTEAAFDHENLRGPDYYR